MDPTACFNEMASSWLEPDYPGCFALAGDLLGWLGKGGFPPAGLSGEQALAVADAFQVACLHCSPTGACNS